ncbi:hypothetical protein NLG97_g7510 [Lecanicillium saksenae]|uniref:Uncharacterized protein n=1 Tax=Lecanicillium saksenae TaxID=468837 RepID=A0ACC1QPK9_9HYPO|nr:hypothetical protein NLG97_g7510 [Lecanicillium saksenae]
MKAVFISIATLAFSAFAAPSVAEGSVAARSAAVAQPEFGVVKREQTAQDLINSITKASDNIKNIGVSVNATLAEVQAGTISKEDGANQTASDVQNLLDEISGIVSEVLAAAHIDVPKPEVQGLLNAVHSLIHNILNIVGTILDVLPVAPLLSGLLQQVVGLLTTLIGALAGVVGGPLIPGLLSIVQSLLGSLTGALLSLLSPVLGPLVAILTGATGSN